MSYLKSRKVFSTRISDSIVKYRLTIEDISTEKGSSEARIRQLALLQELLDSPVLLRCGPLIFDTMQMFHNGTSWVISAEADVYEPQS